MSEFQMEDITLSQWRESEEENSREEEEHWYTKPVSTPNK